MTVFYWVDYILLPPPLQLPVKVQRLEQNTTSPIPGLYSLPIQMYQYRISKRLLYRLSLQVVSSIWYHYSQCSEIISFFFFYRPLIYHQPVDYHLLYAESFDILSSHSSPFESRTYRQINILIFMLAFFCCKKIFFLRYIYSNTNPF